MDQQAQAVIDEYMHRLRRELNALPRARRNEILEDIQDHIDQSLDGLASEADARTLLDQLGDPSEIASEARDRFGVKPARFGARETFALILLALGGFAYLIGWIAGVILLWTSEAWTTREKLLGTLVPPGGLAIPITFLIWEGTEAGESCGGTTNRAGHLAQTCSGGGTDLGTLLLAIGSLLVALLAIAVPIWLGMRARKRTV
jgi:hypothetical protein